MTWEAIRDAVSLVVLAVIYIAFKRKRKREKRE